MSAGTITALVVQTHDHDRVNVFVDGEFALGVHVATLQREGLYKGKVLDEAGWQRLECAESDSKAWESALRLLETRPRSEREIRDRLRQKSYQPEQIEGVVIRLRDLGLIDDQTFAKMWVDNRTANKPKGAQALRQELARKGVDRAIVDATLATIPAADEAAQCAVVAREALRRYADAPDRATFQRRFGGFLQRRGYRFDTIKPILSQLWAEVQPGNDNDD